MWGDCVPLDPQRIVLDSSAQESPRKFRPLRTGKSFLLVVPSRRVLLRSWDKAHYQPGEECRMSIHGQGLGNEPLSVTVESENEDGTWTAVARLQAEVKEGEDQAHVSWRLPGAPVVPGQASLQEVDGSRLTDARFEDPRDLEAGPAVWMLAKAPGFEEGKALQVILEREGDSGSWDTVGEAVATVRSGALRTSVLLEADEKGVAPASGTPEPEPDGSALSGARFEDPRDLAEGPTVWMRAQALGFEGQSLRVVLERQDDSGEWQAVGEAVATVRSGTVRASVALDEANKTS